MPDQETSSNGNDLVIYRLDSLEQKLDRVIAQQDKAQEIRAQQVETLKTVQKDQQEIKETVKDHERRLRIVETAPAKQKAQNWETVTKIIMELVVAAAFGVILAKIGLK